MCESRIHFAKDATSQRGDRNRRRWQSLEGQTRRTGPKRRTPDGAREMGIQTVATRKHSHGSDRTPAAFLRPAVGSKVLPSQCSTVFTGRHPPNDTRRRPLHVDNKPTTDLEEMLIFFVVEAAARVAVKLIKELGSGKGGQQPDNENQPKVSNAHHKLRQRSGEILASHGKSFRTQLATVVRPVRARRSRRCDQPSVGRVVACSLAGLRGMDQGECAPT